MSGKVPSLPIELSVKPVPELSATTTVKGLDCLTIYTTGADHDDALGEVVAYTHSVAKLYDDPWERKHSRGHERCRVGRRLLLDTRRRALLVTVGAVRAYHEMKHDKKFKVGQVTSRQSLNPAFEPVQRSERQ